MDTFFEYFKAVQIQFWNSSSKTRFGYIHDEPARNLYRNLRLIYYRVKDFFKLEG